MPVSYTHLDVYKRQERFSKLEGRIVSAGEVLDMISKKKVTFEDVKDLSLIHIFRLMQKSIV